MASASRARILAAAALTAAALAGPAACRSAAQAAPEPARPARPPAAAPVPAAPGATEAPEAPVAPVAPAAPAVPAPPAARAAPPARPEAPVVVPVPAAPLPPAPFAVPVPPLLPPRPARAGVRVEAPVREAERLAEARRKLEEALRLVEGKSHEEAAEILREVLAAEKAILEASEERVRTIVELRDGEGAGAGFEHRLFPGAPAAPAAEPAEDQVRLRGGDALQGHVVEVRGDEAIRLHHRDLGAVDVPLGKVVEVRFARPKGENDEHKRRSVVAPHVVGLRDGSAVHGRVVGASAGAVTLGLSFGGGLEATAEVPLDRVASLTFRDAEPGEPVEEQDRLYFVGDDRLTGHFGGMLDGSVLFEVRSGRIATVIGVPTDRLASVAIARGRGAAPAPAAAAAGVPIVRLRRGALRGQVVGLDDERLRLVPSWGGELSIPRRLVRAIELEPAEGAKGEAADATERSLIWLARSHGAGGFTMEASRALDFRVDPATGDVITVGTARAGFGGARSEAGDVLHLANGDRLTGDIVSTSAGEIVLDTPYGRMTADRRDVAAIVFRAPATAFLGVRVSGTVAVDPVGDVADILEVTPLSAAERAGLRKGDAIIAIDGVRVKDGPELSQAVRAHPPGKTVTIEILRDGERIPVRATLGERPRGGPR